MLEIDALQALDERLTKCLRVCSPSVTISMPAASWSASSRRMASRLPSSRRSPSRSHGGPELFGSASQPGLGRLPAMVVCSSKIAYARAATSHEAKPQPTYTSDSCSSRSARSHACLRHRVPRPNCGSRPRRYRWWAGARSGSRSKGARRPSRNGGCIPGRTLVDFAHRGLPDRVAQAPVARSATRMSSGRCARLRRASFPIAGSAARSDTAAPDR